MSIVSPMATVFEIVEARRWMCGRMTRMLRAEHQSAAIRLGLDVHRGLRDMYDRSPFFRKAWLIDGHLSALGGATGSALSPASFVWIALSERATRYPVAIIKEARRQLAELMQTKQELTTTIIDGDEAAKRLVVFLGWHVNDTGEGAMAETRYGRKRLTAFIDHEAPRLRFGNGSAIPLGYHSPYEGRA